MKLSEEIQVVLHKADIPEWDVINNWYDEADALEATNAALLEVVKDCVNFLADLNSTSPFDSEYMVNRAKALHKRAYTAHSKAKSHKGRIA